MIQMAIVCAIAKGFVFRQPAAAQAQGGTALQTVLVALWIYNDKIAFYFEGSVGIYSNLSGRHGVILNFRQVKELFPVLHPFHDPVLPLIVTVSELLLRANTENTLIGGQT
ncbi:MAG: hypothetical protein RIQ78_1326 [Bacteroidota bacterium]